MGGDIISIVSKKISSHVISFDIEKTRGFKLIIYNLGDSLSYRMQVEIGNFVCLFSSEEMIENFEERIWPIIKRKQAYHFGRGDDKNFVFHNFKMEQISGEWYVCGRIIRNMKLKSTQKYIHATETLTKRNKSLDDSPSVYFVLRLIDHKLIILRETSRAPGILTVESFFKYGFKVHRQELHEKEMILFKNGLGRNRLTSEQQVEFYDYFAGRYPIAHFRITPITSYAQVQEAFENVRDLQSLIVTLHHTNNEDVSYRNELMRQIMAAKSSIGNGATSSVKIQVADKDLGLDKPQALEIANDVASSNGNASFSASAVSNEGIDITIKDNQLTIKDEVEIEDATNENLKTMAGIQKLIQHAGVVVESDQVTQKRLLLNEIALKLVGVSPR